MRTVEYDCVLVGIREGYTGTLGRDGSGRPRYQFVDGHCRFRTTPDIGENIVAGLSYYSAYRVGSVEHAAAVKAWEQNSENPANKKRKRSQSSVYESEPRPPQTHEGVDSGIPDAPLGGDGVSGWGRRLFEAGEALDHTSDDDWTASGAPKVSALSTLMGEKVTAEDIKKYLPNLRRVE